MVEILSYAPGQQVIIFQEVLNANGVRTNDGYTPVVTRVILPGFTLAMGYPQNMNYLDVGLYYFQFTLPTGAVSVGSYLVDVAYMNPTTSLIVTNAFQIIVGAPYGVYGITSVG